MQHFDAHLMLAEVREADEGKLPPNLRVMAMRTPPPPDKPGTGIIFFRTTDLDAFCRILEAVWLDRRFVQHPEGQRKLFLLGDEVYLQIGATERIEQVGGAGPIRGAVEGFRDHLEQLLQQLERADAVTVETPLGTRDAQYMNVQLPDPAAEADES